IVGEATFGYRVLNAEGIPLYEGKLGVIGGIDSDDFEVNNGSIIVGPFVNYQVGATLDDGARISFDTLTETDAVVDVYEKGGELVGSFNSTEAATKHEIAITGLNPSTEYEYTIEATSTVDGDNYSARLLADDGTSIEDFRYEFETAPAPGSDEPITFAFTSDGRTGSSGILGGERFLAESINAYILKKAAALAAYEGADIFQFSGDLISGYDSDVETHQAELQAWKRTIEPFAGQFPFVAGIGNHDAALSDVFDDGSNFGISIDKFPFETQSGEAIFAEAFVNPENGPISEDGTFYDLNPDTMDFPSYSENAFYYTHGNLAVVNVNSDYWYNPGLKEAVEDDPTQGDIVGGLHGYIMDAQMEWLSDTLDMLDADPTVDHIFVTQHTPIFPNSGHIDDDMWYHGNNNPRPVVQGEDGNNLIDVGIIERRDDYLLELMESEKVRIVLAGDEHNFNITTITEDSEIYPEDWTGEDIRENPSFRPITEMINGAAGAPYYDQGEVPWTPDTEYFTTQYALSLFHIDGDEISVEVINPDTLDYVIGPGELILDTSNPIREIVGTEEPDTLVGGEGNEVLSGLAGNDVVAGGLGNDLVQGDDDDDILRGDLNESSPGGSVGGDDTLHGGQGDDQLGGKGGDDVLFGDIGNDTIFGDAGDDLLTGGVGDDVLTGGDGVDTFVLAEGAGTDTITDFEVGIDLVELAEGLAVDDLSIEQVGVDTVISLGDEVLGIFSGVDAVAMADADPFV
ncbi:MAG: calcium-binding protein, partial [Cyanobacteria bacterium J06592_8]